MNEQIKQANVPEEITPVLWDPATIIYLSIPFTPVFGSFLAGKNWKELGEEAKAERSFAWSIVCAGVFVALLIAALLGGKILICFAVALALYAVWLLAEGRPQMSWVKEKYGTEYERKKWHAPVVLALAGVACVLAMATGANSLLKTTGAGQAKTITYTEQRGRFAYDIPAAWQLTGNNLFPYKVARGEMKDGSAPIILVNDEPYTGNFDDFIECKQKVLRNMNRYSQIEQKTFTTRSGLRGAVIRSFLDDRQNRQDYYYFVNGDHVVALSCVAKGADAQRYDSVFDKIVKSFRLTMN